MSCCTENIYNTVKELKISENSTQKICKIRLEHCEWLEKYETDVLTLSTFS